MHKALTTTLTLATATVLTIGLSPLTASAAPAAKSSLKSLTAIGLAGDRTLVRFDTARPGKSKKLGKVTGLAAGDTDLVGIDYRVQDGKLYGLGRAGGVYAIGVKSLRATKFGQLTIGLEGTSFGVDFNPAADALRVVSDTGQNLRQPFATAGAATVADTPLSTPAVPPVPGPTTGVTGAAYTNNDLDPASGTLLYDLATATNQVALQAPANAGLLSVTGTTSVDLAGDTGFDIYSSLRGGKADALSAFAVNSGRLYSVTLSNGHLTSAGIIGKGAVTDIAIPLDQQ